MRVVVVGGSGLVGASLVGVLQARGEDVVSVSRKTGVDVLSGEGLLAALRGANAVVDVTNTFATEGDKPIAFFATVAENLAAAEREAGVRFHIALSIVGVEHLGGSYFRGKLRQENVISSSGIPHTIVRTTQFFELIERIVRSASQEGIVRLPLANVQPVGSEDVAEEIAQVLLNQPANGVVELAGPERLRLDEVARQIMSMREDMRTIIADPEALYFGSRISESSLLPGPLARIASATFGDWLRRQISAD